MSDDTPKVISVELRFVPLKKYYTQFCAKFGKFPPDTVSLSFNKTVGTLSGNTPGMSVVLHMQDVVESKASKYDMDFTLSKDSIASFVSCKMESATVSMKNSSISVSSGRMSLELPLEDPKPFSIPEPVDNPISAEFQDFLKYSLPIIKKTSCTIARSELFVECHTEDYQNYNVAAVLGKRIHVIESVAESSSVYQNSDDGLSAVIPFDLLEEAVSSEDNVNLSLQKNTIVVTGNDCTATTQTREHSLGVDYATVLNKVKEHEADSVQFQFKAVRLEQMMTSIPKPPSNADYQMIFTLEGDTMSVSYKGKGLKFSDSFKIGAKKPITEKKEFALEYADVLAAAIELPDIADNCMANLSQSRLVLTVKSSLGYVHYLAFARVA